MFGKYPWHLVLQSDGIPGDHIKPYHITMMQFSCGRTRLVGWLSGGYVRV